MMYGPETVTVEAFIRHLKRMTPEQWSAARDAARDAARPAARAVWAAARAAAWDAALAAAWAAAGDATLAAASDAARAAAWAADEIQGAAFMRDRGQPFYFLPMFGFTDPEAVLAADKDHEQ